jgi:hypothetical protein
LQAAKTKADKHVKKLTADITALKATIHQLERIIHVLALENHELQSDRARSNAVARCDAQGRNRPHEGVQPSWRMPHPICWSIHDAMSINHKTGIILR